MTSYVTGGIQTLFAGFAFAGAGIIMHYLQPNTNAQESKRHNKALEQLDRAKEAWYEHTVEKTNKIKALR